MTYLADHEEQIYPRLAEMGDKLRHTMKAAFIEEGIYTYCTGHGSDVLPGSSMSMLHFPYEADAQPNKPKDLLDPSVCDITLSHKVLDLALLLEDVFMLHSHGAVYAAHTEADLDLLGQAYRRAVRRIKAYL